MYLFVHRIVTGWDSRCGRGSSGGDGRSGSGRGCSRGSRQLIEITIVNERREELGKRVDVLEDNVAANRRDKVNRHAGSLPQAHIVDRVKVRVQDF